MNLAQTAPVVFDEHFWKWLIDQGILAVLVVVVLFFYRRDYNSVLKNLTANVEILLQVIRDNNSSNDQLKSATDNLTEEIKNLDRQRIQPRRPKTN